MAIFSFVRNGQTYKINGPAGSTQEQAQAILDAQLISGSLVGQPSGTVINLANQVKSGLNLVGIQLQKTTVPGVAELPPSIPPDVVNFGDIAKQSPGIEIGSMNAEQVRGLLAQRAKSVAQSFSEVSDAKGLGKYGLNINQLEQSGFVKPGTSQLVESGLSLSTVLQNPGCWTGKDSVANLNDLLNSPGLQQQAQQQTLTQAFQSLTAQGLIPPNIVPADLGAVLNTASTFNVQTAADWLQGQLPQEAKSAIDAVARAGQFATTASQVGSLVSQGSFSSAVMLAGSTLGISGAALGPATQALSVFEKVYGSDTALGQTLRTSFGSFGNNISEQFGLGGDVKKLLDTAANAPAQIISDVFGKINSIGANIGTEISASLKSLSGFSGLGDLTSAVGGGQVFEGFSKLATDVFGGGGSSIFDLTRVDALGNEFTINVFSELKLNVASAADSIGQLFGVQNLGNSLFGNFSSISGVGDALGIGGAALGVFKSFFGGGKGDSSGLNFTLDRAPRPVPSFQNTVNRATVDAAVTRIVGDARVTNLTFGSSLENILRPIKVDTTGIFNVKSLIGAVSAQASKKQAVEVYAVPESGSGVF